MPEAGYADPLGRGAICRAGTDATVVTVAPLLAEALKVAGQLAAEGISIEVLDPRSLLPFDHALLRQSVVKTGRLILFDDANRTCGFCGGGRCLGRGRGVREPAGSHPIISHRY